MNSFAQSQAHVKEYIRKATTGGCPEVRHVAELIAEDMVEEEVRMENALLALLILKQYQIKKRRNSSSGDGEEEEDEEDYEDDDEVTDETPVDPRRDNVLSRKRARSPSREITPCPGPNRESLMMLQARKRVKTEPTSTPSTALTTPASTSPPVAHAAMASTPRASSATLPVQRPLHFGALPAAAAAAALARAQAQMPPRMPPAMPQRPVGATTTTTSRTISGARITTTITSAGGITTRMVSAPSAAAAAATNPANVAAPRPMAVPRPVMATSRPVAGSRPVITARGLGVPNHTTTTNALPAAVIANKQGLSTTNPAAPRGLGNATATGTTPGPKPFTITIPPGARRPDATCIRAMRDVKARMTGQATDAHIAAVCRKFLVYPKLPTAYLAVCDEGKQDLFWMFAGDMSTLQLRVLDNCEPASMLYAKGILKRRMGPYVPPWPVRAPAQQQAPQPLGYNSVLKTQHMKEIDLRPRPSLRDRVTTWLGNVSGP